jgi:hypothetical protein
VGSDDVSAGTKRCVPSPRSPRPSTSLNRSSANPTLPAGNLEYSLDGFAVTKPVSILRFIGMLFSQVILESRLEFFSCVLRISILGRYEGLAAPRTLVSQRFALGPRGRYEAGFFIWLHEFVSLGREAFEVFASEANLRVSERRQNAKASVKPIAISGVRAGARQETKGG